MKELKEDIKRCVDFHGHLCPGLALGIVAARAGLEALGVGRSMDEEVVSILETDACCADAVQVLTGSTFGKGNFIYKEIGKVAFSFISRGRNKQVRYCLKPHVVTLTPVHQALQMRVIDGSASNDEVREYWTLHNQKAEEVLRQPWDALFSMQTLVPEMPPMAKIEPSRPCHQCGEPVMASMLQEVNGVALCCACKEKEAAVSTVG